MQYKTILTFAIYIALLFFASAYIYVYWEANPSHAVTDALKQYVPSIITALAILIVADISVRIIKHISFSQEETTGEVGVKKTIATIIWIIAITAALVQIYGAIASILVSASIIGVALAFVLQKSILSAAGWAAISSGKLYSVGDRITIGGISGDVLDIGFMHTTLAETIAEDRGVETGRIVKVPNSIVFSEPVKNHSQGYPYVWLEIPIAVTYESDIHAAKTLLLDSIHDVLQDDIEKAAKQRQKYMRSVGLKKYGRNEPYITINLEDSWIKLVGHVLVKVGKTQQAQTEINEKVMSHVGKGEFKRVAIAYPHIQVVGR